MRDGGLRASAYQEPNPDVIEIHANLLRFSQEIVLYCQARGQF